MTMRPGDFLFSAPDLPPNLTPALQILIAEGHEFMHNYWALR